MQALDFSNRRILLGTAIAGAIGLVTCSVGLGRLILFIAAQVGIL